MNTFHNVAAAALLSLTAVPASAQNANAELLAHLDRITSTQVEILNRLEKIEKQNEQVGQLKTRVDAMTAQQSAILRQVSMTQQPSARGAQTTTQTVARAGNTTSTTANTLASPITIDIGKGRTRGSENATVVLLAFTEFQCPYCRRFHEDKFPMIDQEYIQSGKVRFVVRDHLLAGHKDAGPAAVAARCAESKGLYFEMMDALFTDRDLSHDALVSRAVGIGLNRQEFLACIDKAIPSQVVASDKELATKLNVRGIPNFLIGYAKPGSTEVTFVRRLAGDKPIEMFRTGLDDVLTNPKYAVK